MDAELHLVTRCEHGKVDPHILGWNAEPCEGGSTEVLDPTERVVIGIGLDGRTSVDAMVTALLGSRPSTAALTDGRP